MGKVLSSKSMNISYGKFSIRLDGFDDPFPVMQRVTEYFRRIVETDPTFGDIDLLESEDTLGLVTQAFAKRDLSLDTEDGGFLIQPTTEFAEAAFLDNTPVNLGIERAEPVAEEQTAGARPRLTLSAPVTEAANKTPFKKFNAKKFDMVDSAFKEPGATSKVLRIIRNNEVDLVDKEVVAEDIPNKKPADRVEITDAAIKIQSSKNGFKRLRLNKEASVDAEDAVMIERVAANL